ncbi:MAG: alkaline phosphatase family protein [Gammaproteobacteria bacterium]|nr:alkaline phosphatase family protein [Gammaproteobacteria bacterium]
MASIAEAMGVPKNLYQPLDYLPSSGLEKSDTIILLMIDGLGYEFLKTHATNSFIFSQTKSSLTSVFPSTTASAVTSFATGQAPAQHAVTGWFMLFEKLKEVMAVLPVKPRNNVQLNLTLEELKVQLDLPKNLMEQGTRTNYTLYPQYIVDSLYSQLINSNSTRIGYKGLEEFFAKLETLAQNNTGKQYIYAYWPDFDALTHELGAAHSDVLALFSQLDNAFKKFTEKMQDRNCKILLTADHGLIDIEAGNTIWLNEYPEIMDCLLYPLCGEPRAAYCYIKPGMHQTFEAMVSSQLGQKLVCVESKSLVEQGYFGKLPASSQFQSRIGDYVLIPKGNFAIKDKLDSEDYYVQKAVHGGLSSMEMRIPLVVI